MRCSFRMLALQRSTASDELQESGEKTDFILNVCNYLTGRLLAASVVRVQR
jgi:hypothetical protein